MAGMKGKVTGLASKYQTLCYHMITIPVKEKFKWGRKTLKREILSDRVGMFHRLVYPAGSLRMTMLIAWSVQEWRSVAEEWKILGKREEQEDRENFKGPTFRAARKMGHPVGWQALRVCQPSLKSLGRPPPQPRGPSCLPQR